MKASLLEPFTTLNPFLFLSSLETTIFSTAQFVIAFKFTKIQACFV